MKKHAYTYLLIFIFILGATSVSFKNIEEKDKARLSKPTINDNYNYIGINQVLMWVSNNGDGSHDPKTDGNGFYWPGGINATKSAIFEDGLIYAGKIGRELRMNGNTHRQGLQAGKILDTELPDNPNLDKYRVYKIRKGWESIPAGPEKSALEKDYKEWPVEDGAPWVDVDNDGIFTRGVDTPHFIGDEVLWYVANDIDPARTTFTYGSQPLGLEFQTTIFGFNRTGPLGDMVFKKYKVINKGGNLINDMYLGYWSDTDMGDANDDYTGCDTILSLGYTWNGKPNDGIYGTPPPAVGYDFFQGPVIPYDPVKYPIILEKNLPDSAKFDGKWIKGKTNLPMTAFTFYINPGAGGLASTYRDPTQGNYAGTIEFYNYLQGYIWNGNPFIDPNTGLTTKFVLAGDPVTGTGWYEGRGWPGGPDPADRRHLMCTGPFTMAPGDTQEIVVGILIAIGTDNVNSIKVLKMTDDAAQKAYDLDFKLTDPPPHPKITSVGLDNKIVFYWDDKAETYDEVDKLIEGRGFSDTTYTFEGYEVYQYRDLAGTDPVLLKTYDVVNGVTKILDYQTVQGENVLLPVAAGSNSDLVRYHELSVDNYTQTTLRNGTPYYFGVVAYGYCPNSSPKVLKSTHSPIEVYSQKPSISTEYIYNYGSFIDVQKVSGLSDGLIKIKVVDPSRLTGDSYQVFFSKVATNTVWNLVNTTKKDTVLRNQTTFITLEDLTDIDAIEAKMNKNNKIIDGFLVGVVDVSGTETIREISLTKDAGKDVKPVGNVTTYFPRQGVNIFGVGSTTSSRGWWITADDAASPTPISIQNLNWQKKAGVNDYEIRFTADSSEFYIPSPGFTTDIFRSNPKSLKSKVPLQFWDIGDKNNPADDKRLYVKVFETKLTGVKDSLWTSTVINKDFVRRDSIQFEELYFMRPLPDIYLDPIPATSGTTTADRYPIGKFTLMMKSNNDFPKPGTVIRIATWKTITLSDTFAFVATKPKMNDVAVGKNNMDKIGVFPNPYFGANSLERDKYQRFVRFTNLPSQVTIRIFSLAGVFINKIDKDDPSTFADWDLRNINGLPVASGVYIAYLEMPGIGSKILKIAVIMETQYIDRL